MLASSVLLVAGCGGSSHHAAGKSGPAKTTSRAAPPPTTPRPTVDPGIAPSAYRAQLAAAARPLNQALAALPQSRAMTALAGRLATAERAASSAVTRLGRLDPPRPVRTEHSRVVAGLRQLATDLGTVREAVGNQELCATSVALSSVNRRAGAHALGTAVGALRAKGYRFGVVLPPTPAHGTPQPATGTFLKSGDRSSHGQLTIENGSDGDAVLSLAVGHNALISVFVRKGANYQIDGINDGTYSIYYSGGADWDASINGFARDCSFSKFDKPLTFSTTSSGYFEQYSTWTLTLFPVFGGNATTSRVSPQNYPR